MTTATAPALRPLSEVEWSEPGRGAGLLDVARRRYLLTLIVRKELRVRYRGSVLGLAWSYVKPAVQYLVYYLALGIFLGQDKNVEHYPVYLFSGLVVTNVFAESFSNATRAVVNNAALVKKIYLPREMFPVASVLVAGVHFVPQVIVLVIGALATGWHPPLLALPLFLVGTLVVAMLATGLGMVFGALNVFYRDLENIVDLILMVVVWLSPVLYAWERVAVVVGHGSVTAGEGSWVLKLYQANPLTTAVEMYHRAFWWPTVPAGDRALSVATQQAGQYALPPDLLVHGVLAVAVTAVVLVAGQLVFRKTEGRFAQEL